MSASSMPNLGKSPFAGPLQPEMVPDLLSRYGELLEKHPAEMIDVSWLPATKLIMIQAFKSAWLGTNDLNKRGWIETAWAMLSSFQDGVGSRPIGCDITGMSMKNAAALLDRYADLAKRCEAESEVLFASMTAFKAANSCQARN